MRAPDIARGRARRLAILATTSLVAASLLSGASIAIAASGGKDHFKATIAADGGGEAGELRTPLQFEEEAANAPGVGTQTLFSRCRRDLGAKVYGPFGPQEHDAIVGDTSFAFPDGTSCFNPQNEQNIVINPGNSRNLVTSANEYRAIEQAVYVSKDGGASWTDVALRGWTRSTGGSGAFSTSTRAAIRSSRSMRMAAGSTSPSSSATSTSPRGRSRASQSPAPRTAAATGRRRR